jgi:hypothetical protein
MYKRLFTFGCSFTSWYWPTWADIIAWDLDIPNENWGISGLGNVGIFHRLVECDVRNTFQKDDLIAIMWSHWNREDRYMDQFWQGVGNVFNNHLYGEKFIKKYWSFENDIIKNSTAMISANKMYDINFQGNITHPSMNDNDVRIFTDYESMMFNVYKKHINLDNVFVYDTSKSFNNMIDDDKHPDILQHLEYLTKYVYPSLGLTIKDTTVNVCREIQKDIIDALTDSKNLKFEKRMPIILDIVTNKHKLIFELPKHGPCFGTKHYGF